MPTQVAISPKAVTVTLDRERTLVYDKRAEYRMGTLDRPFVIQDLNRTRRSFAALVAWVWACLSEKDALSFPSPEILASLIDESNVDVIFAGFVETWTAAQSVDPGDKAKNG